MEERCEQQSILIVDDSEFNIKYLEEILQEHYQIQTANSGQKALEIAFSNNPPDLILLDVVMPDINGYDVCIKLKQTDNTKNIPIMFITGNAKEEDEIYGFSIGAVDYISKPFSPTIVKARVKTHVELKKYRDYLESISYLDGLTGIANRRRLNEQFEIMWEFAKREKRVVSVIMMDIDYFKAFNDIYGHLKGDDCLIQLAYQLAKTVVRKTDIVGRYGGEEFMCAMLSTDLENTFMIAEKMRQRVMALAILHEGSKTGDVVTISLGIAACIPEKNEQSSNLILKADNALYYSKKTGKNKTSIYKQVD